MLSANEIHDALARMQDFEEFERLIRYAPNDAEGRAVERFYAAYKSSQQQDGIPFMPLPVILNYAPRTVLAALICFLMGGEEE